MSRESELAATVRRFPAWECWRGVSGLFYARRRGTADEPVRGESPEDLGDQIERERRQAADRYAERTMDVIDRAVADGILPG